MSCHVQTVDEVSERYDKYDYNTAGIAAYNFLWDEFADWAIEASKVCVRFAQGLGHVGISVAPCVHPFMRGRIPLSATHLHTAPNTQLCILTTRPPQTRTYGGDAAAQAASRATLVYVFESVLRLLHPFMPFVTEELWQAIPHKGGVVWGTACSTKHFWHRHSH